MINAPVCRELVRIHQWINRTNFQTWLWGWSCNSYDCTTAVCRKSYFIVWLDKRGTHPKYLSDVKERSEMENDAHFIWSDRAVVACSGRTHQIQQSSFQLPLRWSGGRRICYPAIWHGLSCNHMFLHTVICGLDKHYMVLYQLLSDYLRFD